MWLPKVELLTSAGWVTLTDVQYPITVRRGRNRDIDEFTAGTASFQLDNTDRRYDPSNTASDLYGELKPMRQVRLSAVDAESYGDVYSDSYRGAGAPLFYGFVEDWPVHDHETTLSTVSVRMIDGLGVLAGQEVDALEVEAHGGDTTGGRVARILALPEVAWSGATDIDSGLSVLGSTTLGANALQLLQAVGRSELGALFVAADGTLTFRQRWADRPSGPEFSGDLSATPYQDAPRDYSRNQIHNRISGAGTSGVSQTVEDVTSQGEFQVRSLTRNVELQDDSEVLEHLDWLLARFKEPELRFTGVDVHVGALSAAQRVDLFALELGDRVTIHKNPVGGGDAIVQLAVVDSLSWRWTGFSSLSCTVGVSAGVKLIPFTLDDPIAGVLDSEHRLGY